MTVSSEVFNSDFLALTLQQFINDILGFPISVLVPTEVSAPVNSDSLHSSVSLSNLGGSSFPCDLLLRQI